jgi:hypothetical protein
MKNFVQNSKTGLPQIRKRRFACSRRRRDFIGNRLSKRWRIVVRRELAANVFKGRNHIQNSPLVEIGEEKHPLIYDSKN